MKFTELFHGVLRKIGYKIIRYENEIFSENSIHTYEYLRDFSERVSEVPGVFVECGFGVGKSFMPLATLASKQGRTIFGFDSFAGFPTPSVHDRSLRDPRKGEWSRRTVREAYRQIEAFKGRNLATNEVHLIPGFVENTLPSFKAPDGIALLHIDLDLHDAYFSALTSLFPQLNSGGVVIFDEYREEKWPGATRAIDKFFENYSEGIQLHKSGKFFAVKL